jgi:hypothetical protein
MNALTVFKPNGWNMSGLLVGLCSGFLIALGMFDVEGTALFYGLLFGVFSTLVLAPLFESTGVALWRIAIWIPVWILCSGLSWYLAFQSYLHPPFGAALSKYPYAIIVVASTVGVVILLAAVSFLGRWFRVSMYMLIIAVAALVSIASVQLAVATQIGDRVYRNEPSMEGYFNGTLDGDVDLIHPLWEATVLYMLVSLLRRPKKPLG